MAQIVSLYILLAMTLFAFILFFIKSKKLLYENELLRIVATSSSGGYYLWFASNGKEYFSSNLIKLFNLKNANQTLEGLIDNFLTFNLEIKTAFNEIKEGKKSYFCRNFDYIVDELERSFICNIIRVDSGFGNIKAVVVWFYEVSDYVQKMKNISIDNNKMKHKLKNYVHILDSISVPVWMRNENLSIEFCNKAYLDIFENNIKKKAKEQIPEIDEKIIKLASESWEIGRTGSIKRHIIANSERKYLQINEVPLLSRGIMVGYAIDMTEEEKTEKELKMHVSAHADLLESSSSAIVIFDTDSRLKFYNASYAKLWQINEKYLTKSPQYSEILEILREKRMLPEQIDFKAFRERQLSLFKNLIKAEEDFYHLPDGRTLRVISIPHAFGGILFAYEDISDKLAIEASYNTLTAVQKETLDNLKEGIVVVSQSGKIQLYNPVYNKIWLNEEGSVRENYNFNELFDTKRSFFHSENDWKDFRNDFIASIETRKTISKIYELKNDKFIDRMYIPLPDGGILISDLDVSDTRLLERSLREKNEALEYADKIKNEFLTNISYELRTPLTSIIGFTQAIMAGYCGQVNNLQMEYIRDINLASLNLSSIINDLLDLSSMQSGFAKMEFAKYSVNDLLLTLFQEFRNKANDSKIKFSIDCEKDIGQIYIDDKRITQVLFHIISNSLKFTDMNGRIILSARNYNDLYTAITVTDTGINVPKSEIKEIFNKFFKAKSIRYISRFGTGLGLSVIKNIIDLHSGKIMAESRSGKGMKITLLLPKEKIIAKIDKSK